MMSGFEGATASEPTEPVGCPSKIGFHVRPKSSLFQTPPSVAAMKKTLGWSGIPSIATVRPARNGPIQRQRISWYIAGLNCCATANAPHNKKAVIYDDRRIDIMRGPLSEANENKSWNETCHLDR